MYGQYAYSVSVPNNKQSKFGVTLTSRYRKEGRLAFTYYIVAGSARMETDEKTVIGELNESATWINGRLEIDKDTHKILYREYDEKGSKVRNSTQEYVNFEWVKSAKGSADKIKIATRKEKNDAEKNKLTPEKENVAADRDNPATEYNTDNLDNLKNVVPKTEKVEKLSNFSNDALSVTTNVSQLSESTAKPVLETFGLNLEALGGSGSSKTFTVIKKKSILGSVR